jgi:hypothetical protein
VNLASSVSNVLIAIASGGAGLAVINQVFARRKTNAEAESIEADTAAKLLRGVSDELERLQGRQIALEKRFTESETIRLDVEARAREITAAEKETRRHLATLQRAYTATRARVDYLTEVVKEAGLTVAPWTPPSGIPSPGKDRDSAQEKK